MERKVANVDEKEVLYYLGIQKDKIDEQLRERMNIVETDILTNVKPRLVYRMYDYHDGIIEDCSLKLAGKDIEELLATSSKCILMAATLGTWMDQRIKKAQIQDMGNAILYDAYANAAIEAVIDEWQKELSEQLQLKGWYLSDRFSCGYGDFPLSLQPIFLKELQATKQIGLQVGESLLMKPEKSVTALLGVSRCIQPAMVRGCACCALQETCTKRKEGQVCGRK